MNKICVFGLAAILLLAVVVSASENPFDKGWQRQIGRYNLYELDYRCSSIEVHKGYFVKQIAVRTSRGLECQFPSGDDGSIKSKPKPKPVFVPEPECSFEEVCSDVCEWVKIWKCFGGGHHKFCWWDWNLSCEESCQDVKICSD